MPNIKEPSKLLTFNFDPSGGLIKFNQPAGIFFADKEELKLDKMPDYFKLRNVINNNIILFQKGVAYKDDFKNVLHWEYRSVQNSRYQVYFRISNISTLIPQKKKTLLDRLKEFKGMFIDFPYKDDIDSLVEKIINYSPSLSSSSSSSNNS